MSKKAMVCVVLFAAACGKKADDNKAQPEATPKVVEQQKKPPALMRVPVTSKSPEAIAEYDKARDLWDHSRPAESIEHLRKAIQLDPEFARAYADLGLILPSSEGTELLAKAGPLAAKLPESERLYVEAAQAIRAGDEAKATAGMTKLLELAPGQWEIKLQLAYNANEHGDSDGAIKGAQDVLAMKPDAATAYNLIAYGYASKKAWEPAIAAAKKQVELMPTEPNPVDSLAEIQLKAGKFADAEASFVQATKLQPTFSIAFSGTALARAYQGNFKTAYEAYAEQQKSPAPGAKQDAMLDTAWILFAEGKSKEALAALDALDKDADAKKMPTYAYASVARTMMLTESGKYADAAKASAETLKRAEDLAGDAKGRIVRSARLDILRIAALSGKPAADSDKLVAGIEDSIKAQPASSFLTSVIDYTHGLVLQAKGDAKGAIAEMTKCEESSVLCRYDLAALQRKAGDAAGADATAKAIKANPVRESSVVYYWSHVGPASK